MKISIPSPLNYIDRRTIAIVQIAAVTFVIMLPATEWRDGLLLGLCFSGVAIGVLAMCAIRDISKIAAAANEVRECHINLHQRADALEAERDAWKGIWEDPAALQVHLLRSGALSRMNALHIAGATDYDALKAEVERLREFCSKISGVKLL